MNLKKNDLFWIIPLALMLGAGLSSLQSGNRLIGLASFSFLFLLSFSLFTILLRWAGAGKTLAYILALTFALRLLAGVSLYAFLPIYGYDDADDKAGFVFTDAHRRDDEAWELASSGRPIFDAFSKKFAYDQYGGLLAFSALVYRYLSPDAHRPLMLALMSAVVAALGIPFLWRAVNQIFGGKVAWASAWIFALYPESILLGSTVMREPYLLTFSALSLWGFVQWRGVSSTRSAPLNASLWMGVGLLGMLLVSPAVAIATLIVFAGWIFFASDPRALSWKVILVFALVFFAGLLFLSASLNRSGEFDASSPLSVVNDWLRLAVNWNVYNIERDSGWVQKLFDEMPEWMRLPFVAVYGILQPVLPAALIAPTKPIWKIVYILRALGWYATLPALILSFGAGSGFNVGKRRVERSAIPTGESVSKSRSVILWLALFSWTWILLASLRGGGDQWDNPRYRTILFLWQAILAGAVWVWQRETRSAWFARVILCEAAFLIVFTQWYASRYFHWGGQLPFAGMAALIFGLWAAIVGMGWWRDRERM